MQRTLARLAVVLVLALSLWCGVASAQAPPPITNRSALVKAQEVLAEIEKRLLASPDGQLFLKAREVVQQLQALQPPPQVSKVEPEKK